MSAQPPVTDTPRRIEHPFDQLLDIDRRSVGRYQSSAEMSQVAERGGRVALRLGNWYLMFAMDDIGELVPLPRLTRVPGVKPWFLGIANLRGMVVSVADLRHFLTGRPAKINANSRIVILRSGEDEFGILMDEVIGMRHFGDDLAVDPKGQIEDALLPLVTKAFKADDRLWLQFDARQLVSNPGFLAAEA